MKDLVLRARRYGLRPFEIAVKIGCTPDAVYKWEQEYSRKPTKQHREKLERLVTGLERKPKGKTVH